MPPRLRVRASYQHDAAFMLRLAEAIESDHILPVTDRQDVIAKLNALAHMLTDLNTHKQRIIASITNGKD